MITTTRTAMKLILLALLAGITGCVGDSPSAPEVPGAWLQTTVSKPCMGALYSTNGVPDSVVVCLTAK